MPVPYLYYDVDFYLYQVYEMQLPRIIKYMYTAKGQPMPAVVPLYSTGTICDSNDSQCSLWHATICGMSQVC